MITGAVTAQAHQLQRYLDNKATVIFADSVELPQVLQGSSFVKIPPGVSATFAHMLLTICLDLNVDEVYPLRKDELKALAEARQLFDEYAIKVMVPPKALIDGLLNKGIKGRVIVKDGSVIDEMPDRGIFLIDEAGKEFQLLTAD